MSTTTTPPPKSLRERHPRARERDRALYKLVLRFREDPRADLWWLLLDWMLPTLAIRTGRYRGKSALFGSDDLLQEMALALRETALTIPLTSDAYLERRLGMRTANRVTRRFQREAAYQDYLEPLEALEPDTEEEGDES